MAGILGAEVGAALPWIASALALGPDELGWIVSSRFVGGLVTTLVLVAWPPRRSFLPAVIVGLLFTAISALLTVTADSFGALFVASLLRGMTAGLLISNANFAVNAWFAHRPGRYAALVNAAFGAGLVLAPPLAGVAWRYTGLWWTAWMPAVAVAGITLPLVLTWWRSLAITDRDDPPRPANGTAMRPTPEGDAASAVATAPPATIHPVAIQATTVLIVGVEALVLGWVPTAIATSTTLASDGAAFLIAIAIFLGRIAAAAWSDGANVARWHRWSVVALIVAFVLTIRPVGLVVGAAVALVAGAAMSGLFPTIVAMLVRGGTPGGGRAFMLLGVSGALGGTALPAIVGYGVAEIGMIALALTAIPAAVAAFVVGRIAFGRAALYDHTV